MSNLKLIFLLLLTFTSLSNNLFADGIDAWFAIDRFLEINTKLALKDHSMVSKSYPNGKANLLSHHQLTSEYSMIQNVLEDNFEKGDIYSGQILAWLCKKNIIDLDDNICRKTNSEIFPLHRVFGNQIQDSLEAYFNYFRLPIKGQTFELGGQSIRVVSVTTEKNGKRVSNSLKKQEKERKKNIDKLVHFSEKGNPFAQLLLANIALETSQNLIHVEKLYRDSAVHPFPLGMKAYRRFCSAHSDYCQDKRIKQKVESELALLEKDPSGRLVKEEYHNTYSELYQLYPEHLQRFQNQWIIYQHLYGKGDFYHIADLYLANMLHSAVDWNDIERKEEAARWVNHGINFQIDNFSDFAEVSQAWERQRQEGLYGNLDINLVPIDSIYKELILGKNTDSLSGKTKIFIASYLAGKTIASNPNSTEITWLSQLKFEILDELEHLSHIDKTMILNQIGRAFELGEKDYVRAHKVYLQARSFAEFARIKAIQSGKPQEAEELRGMSLTNGYNAANAAILAKDMSNSTRSIIEDTLFGGEEDIKSLFIYFVANTNRSEDILWAIDILNSGRIAELSISRHEQLLISQYFSESLLPFFEETDKIEEEEENGLNTVNSSDAQVLPSIALQPIEEGDLSDFRTIETKKRVASPKITHEDPKKFEEFIKKKTARIGNCYEVSFDGIKDFMSGSLLELATQNHLGGVRNFVVALGDEDKIREYNIPSLELLKYKGTSSLEFDGAFYDSNRDEIFWYDVKSINYSNEFIDFEKIVSDLKRHKIAAFKYSANFLFISKNPVSRPVAKMLEDANIEWISILGKN